jgi:hypothetical protein
MSNGIDKIRERALEQLNDLYEAYKHQQEFSTWEEDYIVSLQEKHEKYQDKMFLSDAQINKLDELWEEHCQ